MGARQCAETFEAIRLHRSGGLSLSAAAKATGIARSTLQRALKKLPQRNKKRR